MYIKSCSIKEGDKSACVVRPRKDLAFFSTLPSPSSQLTL